MPMTSQEIFDKVATHLLSMKNGRAMVKAEYGYRCAYLTPEGEKCSIGCLIPDNHPALDANVNMGVMSLFDNYPELNDIILPILDDDNNSIFLTDLQWLHDNEDSWEEGKLSNRGINRLIRIGRDEGLDVSVVEDYIKK